MRQKPSIAIVGAGNLGTALAISLREAGYRIEVVIGRARGKSLTRARSLAKRTGAGAVADLKNVDARVLWLCVPDREIAHAAARLSETLHGKGRIALHSSGALTSDELAPLRKKGVAVASVHPMMTFVKRSRPSLQGVPFAIEGDREAVLVARTIVQALGGEAHSIGKKKKRAYHAWGTFASPLLTALLVTTEEVAALAGVKGKAARRWMLPILLQTVRNYAALGAAEGFSGPIIRGDTDTVQRHLEILGEGSVPRAVYRALALAALAYLPTKNKKLLKELIAHP